MVGNLYLFFSPKRNLLNLYFPGNFHTKLCQPTETSPEFRTLQTLLWEWLYSFSGLMGVSPGVILIVCSITNQSQLFGLPNNLLVQSFYYNICAYCIQISQEKKQVPRNPAARNKRAPVSRAQMRKSLGFSFS